MPIFIVPSGYGIRVFLTRQAPSLLLEWLRDQGEVIQHLRGSCINGVQLCGFLDFWLRTSQLTNEDKISFEGVLGETDETIFLQRPYADVIITFDDFCFDGIGRHIIEEVKKRGIKLKES